MLAEGLSGYPISDHERVEQREDLQQSGRHKVEGLVQQAADTALSRMKDRSAPCGSQQLCLIFAAGYNERHGL